MSMYINLLVFFGSCYLPFVKMETLVKLSDGLIKGTTRTKSNNEPFYSFTCIPYGKAPIGDLRFKAPQPVEPWEGVKDVTKEENFCYHASFLSKSEGSEDCLSLHVFTKKLPKEEDKLKPVMVYVHGGGFLSGTHQTSSYGPEYIMTEDVVLVSITYRVGILGFIRFNDVSLNVPGNTGLKDQVLALKWVRKNIQNFNGDPNNVTIWGESAGGASVQFLLLSLSAKDLFHRAIIQSGSVLNPWARGKFESSDLANFLGKPNLSEKELLTELNQMPISELYETQTTFLTSKKIFGNFGFFAPVVEQPNPTAFLTKEPMDIIQSGQYNTVPVIIGYSDNEGALGLLLEKLANDTYYKDIKTMLPYETDMKNIDQVKKIIKILEEYYYNDQNKDNTTLLLTDAYFVAGIITSAKNQAKTSKQPIYMYRFTLHTKLNFNTVLANLNISGACHGDVLGYLFKRSLPEKIDDTERTDIRRMVSMWTNFAKFGNPTPKGSDLNIEWKPIEKDQLNFLNIGNELTMEVNPEAERMEIWNEIYQLNPRTSHY